MLFSKIFKTIFMGRFKKSLTMVSSRLVPRRSLLPRCPREVWERAGERTPRIPLILAQFYPWSHFTSFYSSILEKLLADSMDVSVEVSANSGKF